MPTGITKAQSHWAMENGYYFLKVRIGGVGFLVAQHVPLQIGHFFLA